MTLAGRGWRDSPCARRRSGRHGKRSSGLRICAPSSRPGGPPPGRAAPRVTGDRGTFAGRRSRPRSPSRDRPGRAGGRDGGPGLCPGPGHMPPRLGGGGSDDRERGGPTPPLRAWAFQPWPRSRAGTADGGGGRWEVFRAFEAALHARCLSALVGLVGEGLPLKASRRLQLAAEGAEAPLVLVLRPAGPGSPNGAATRWSVASAPGAIDRFGTLRAPRWRARLERCRNGRGGSWLLEWDSAAHRLRLPERLARDSVAAGRASL